MVREAVVIFLRSHQILLRHHPSGCQFRGGEICCYERRFRPWSRPTDGDDGVGEDLEQDQKGDALLLHLAAAATDEDDENIKIENDVPNRNAFTPSAVVILSHSVRWFQDSAVESE